jgi:hypothetical protein
MEKENGISEQTLHVGAVPHAFAFQQEDEKLCRFGRARIAPNGVYVWRLPQSCRQSQAAAMMAGYFSGRSRVTILNQVECQGLLRVPFYP